MNHRMSSYVLTGDESGCNTIAAKMFADVDSAECLSDGAVFHNCICVSNVGGGIEFKVSGGSLEFTDCHFENNTKRDAHHILSL